MYIEMQITQARDSLMSLPEQLKEGKVVRLTRRKEAVMALMSWEHYEAIIQTLEILGDAEKTESLLKSIKEFKSGKVIE